jgi:hypothetical protein
MTAHPAREHDEAIRSFKQLLLRDLASPGGFGIAV